MNRLTDSEAANGLRKMQNINYKLTENDLIYIKLAAYEDFGLSPSELTALAKSQINTAKSNIELSERIETLDNQIAEFKKGLAEYIQRLMDLRDLEIWAICNFNRDDFCDDASFVKFVKRTKKEVEAYTLAIKFAEMLAEHIGITKIKKRSKKHERI